MTPLQLQTARLRTAYGMTEAQAHAFAALIWGPHE